MSLEEKRKLIERGRQELSNGVFPNLTLESIKDSRLRKDVSKSIFNLSGEKFDDLPKEEKEKRKNRLKVILKFEDYLLSFIMFRNASYILLIIGLITFFSSFIGADNNLFFGVITLIIGFSILLISLNKKLVLKFILTVGILYIVIYLLELLFLGLPSPYLYVIDNDILASRRGAIPRIFNVLTPYIYIIARLVIGWVIFAAYKKQLNFIKAKTEYETIVANHVYNS